MHVTRAEAAFYISYSKSLREGREKRKNKMNKKDTIFKLIIEKSKNLVKKLK